MRHEAARPESALPRAPGAVHEAAVGPRADVAAASKRCLERRAAPRAGSSARPSRRPATASSRLSHDEAGHAVLDRPPAPTRGARRRPACRRRGPRSSRGRTAPPSRSGRAARGRRRESRPSRAPPTSPTNSTSGATREKRLDLSLEVCSLLRRRPSPRSCSGMPARRAISMARSTRFSGETRPRKARYRPGRSGTCGGRAAARGGSSPASSPRDRARAASSEIETRGTPGTRRESGPRSGG